VSPTRFRTAPFGALWLWYYGFVGLFNPYSPLWLSHLGYSTLAIGAFASLQSWTRVVAPYGCGWLADHGGRRVTLLRLAAVLSALAAAGLWWVRDAGAWPLALVIAALFLANGAFTPIGETLLLKHLHGGRGLDARRYGRVRLWGSVGFIVSCCPSASCAAHRHRRVAAVHLRRVRAAGLGRVARARAGRIPGRHAAAARAHRTGAAPARGTLVLRRRDAHRAGTHGAVCLLLAVPGQPGLRQPAVGMLWGVSVAVEIVFFALAGRHFARLGEYRWLVLAALVTAARFALTAGFGSVPAVLVLAQLMHALTFAAHHMPVPA